jgi:hypothetical protein
MTQTRFASIPGLRYVPEYLDQRTHDRLLADADAQPWQPAGDRRVQIYGYSYHHTKGGMYRIGDLPAWAADIARGLWRDGLMPHPPDQMIANDYEPGAGIFPHVDAAAFDDTIVSLSLGSTCVMQFTANASGRMEELLLEPRSALVLSGEARHAWKHLIPPRLEDVWLNQTLMRSRRVSMTFRRMLQTSGTPASA